MIKHPAFVAMLGAALCLTGSGLAAAPVQSTEASQQCKDAYDRAGLDGRSPPSSAGAVAQMQWVLYLYQEQMKAVRESCQDWPLRERSLEQMQAQVDATMRTCRQVATNEADCRPVARWAGSQ